MEPFDGNLHTFAELLLLEEATPFEETTTPFEDREKKEFEPEGLGKKELALEGLEREDELGLEILEQEDKLRVEGLEREEKLAVRGLERKEELIVKGFEREGLGPEDFIIREGREAEEFKLGGFGEELLGLTKKVLEGSTLDLLLLIWERSGGTVCEVLLVVVMTEEVVKDGTEWTTSFSSLLKKLKIVFVSLIGTKVEDFLEEGTRKLWWTAGRAALFWACLPWKWIRGTKWSNLKDEEHLVRQHKRILKQSSPKSWCSE